MPIDRLRAELGLSVPVLDRCKDYFADQFDYSWDELRNGVAYHPSENAKLLLVCDEDDKQIRLRDADAIKTRWPDATVVRTAGLGHQKILWDANVVNRVVAFNIE